MNKINSNNTSQTDTNMDFKNPSLLKELILKKIILDAQNNHLDFESDSLSKINSNVIYEGMFSPFHINISEKTFSQAKNFIQTIFSIRQNEKYKNWMQSEISQKNLSDPGNHSVFMSYDFHVTQDEDVKLIEVNTNAAFLGLGYYIHKALNYPLPVSDFEIAEIKKNIEDELKKFRNDNSAQVKSIAIIDENPSEQKLYLEFLLFQALFRKWGWQADILDYRDENLANYDVIYNRHTDFYFDQPQSDFLLKLFNSKKVCFSPNPYEYLLLADKKRMIEWRHSEFFNQMNLNDAERNLILQVVPESYLVKNESTDKVWNDRKKMFFKPVNSFGSKQSYKGANISKKVFEDILKGDFIAQEYVPAPEQEYVTPNGTEKFKFDLRCYAYEGRMQMIIARLYQGQVTNSKTPYGGFGLVNIKNNL